MNIFIIRSEGRPSDAHKGQLSGGYNGSVAHRLADEIEDDLELRDPRVREDIRMSRMEYEAGRGRPLDELLAEIAPVRKTRRGA
jgi:hypothetical protein